MLAIVFLLPDSPVGNPKTYSKIPEIKELDDRILFINIPGKRPNNGIQFFEKNCFDCAYFEKKTHDVITSKKNRKVKPYSVFFFWGLVYSGSMFNPTQT